MLPYIAYMDPSWEIVNVVNSFYREYSGDMIAVSKHYGVIQWDHTHPANPYSTVF